MGFYNSSDQGISLDPTKINDLKISLQLTESHLRGFFLKSDLQNLLAKQECVGIRFYSVNPQFGTPNLLAVAAKEDGFELEDTYLQTHTAAGSDHSIPAIQMDRANASSIANAIPLSHQFMSFFSKSTLQNILMSGTFDGLSFYDISLSNATDIELTNNNQNRLVSIKNFTRTLLATTTSLNNGQIPFLNNTDENAFSIHPCPGYCHVMDSTTNACIPRIIPSTVSVSTPGDPYLFKW